VKLPVHDRNETVQFGPRFLPRRRAFIKDCRFIPRTGAFAGFISHRFWLSAEFVCPPLLSVSFMKRAVRREIHFYGFDI